MIDKETNIKQLDNKPIILLVGSMRQADWWIRHRIKVVYNKQSMEKLRGVRSDIVFAEGDYYKWFDNECAGLLARAMSK